MTCPGAPTVAAAWRQTINATTVKYTCLSGYSLQGEQYVHCVTGVWGTLPQCLIIYENHQVDNVVNVFETVTSSEIPNWLLLLIAGTAGIAALSFLVGLLLCCLHLCGCYSGPVVGFGGNHVYPEKKCCDCDVCCCCCCRCFRRCGEDELDDEDDDAANNFYVTVDSGQPPLPPDSPDHSKEVADNIETTALLKGEDTKKTKGDKNAEVKKKAEKSNTGDKTDNSEKSSPPNEEVKIDLTIDEILENTEEIESESKNTDSSKTKGPETENNLPGVVPSPNVLEVTKSNNEAVVNKTLKKTSPKKPSDDILAALDVDTKDEGQKSPNAKKKAVKVKDGAKQRQILGD